MGEEAESAEARGPTRPLGAARPRLVSGQTALGPMFQSLWLSPPAVRNSSQIQICKFRI